MPTKKRLWLSHLLIALSALNFQFGMAFLISAYVVNATGHSDGSPLPSASLGGGMFLFSLFLAWAFWRSLPPHTSEIGK